MHLMMLVVFMVMYLALFLTLNSQGKRKKTTECLRESVKDIKIMESRLDLRKFVGPLISQQNL